MLDIVVAGNGCSVYGSKSGKTFFSGTLEECRKYVANVKRRVARRMKDDAMRSLGMVRVRGAMGGTYWE